MTPESRKCFPPQQEWCWGRKRRGSSVEVEATEKRSNAGIRRQVIEQKTREFPWRRIALWKAVKVDEGQSKSWASKDVEDRSAPGNKVN